MLNIPETARGLPSPAALFAPVAGHKRVGLAVSGGADSLALMLLAARWAADAGVALEVYTVDHGLRPEAAAETAFVVREAGKLGLKARVLRWEDDKPRSGVQAAAREARYRLIGAAMDRDGATVLLTAHHMRDQAETVLMRLAHGSGVSGAGGMMVHAEVFGVPVCRPLLGIAPEVLADVVAKAGISAVEDPSNSNTRFERVRWRQALPALAAEGLDAARLAQFAKRAARADDALRTISDELFCRLAARNGLGVVSIARDEFENLHPELRLRLLRRALDLAGGRQKPYALQQIEELDAGLRGAAFERMTLGGAVIERNPDTIGLYREEGRMAHGDVTIPPGEDVLWDNRFLIANALDEAVRVRRGSDLTRETVEALLPDTLPFSMAQIAGAPVVRGGEGTILAIGTFVLQGGISVTFRDCGTAA